MMKQSVLLAALAACASAQVIEDLINTVCYPSGQLTQRDTKYPCPMIRSTMDICKTNGTSPEQLKAHRDCICDGSYVDDEFGCLDCLWTHGFRGKQDRKHWAGVLSSASAAFCVPTPTADWGQVWASVSQATPYVSATVDNELFNKAVGDTRVEIYYNATRLPQGPGPFTPVPAAASTTSATSFTSVVSTTSSGSAVETSVSTSLPALSGAPGAPAPGMGDGWVRCSGKAEVIETSMAPQPSSVKFGNNTMPTGNTGNTGTTIYVTIVQIFKAKCSAVIKPDGEVKLSCGADEGIPSTIDRAPAKEVVAELPVFKVPSNGQSGPAGDGMSPAPGSVGGSPVGGKPGSGSNTGAPGSPAGVVAPGSPVYGDDGCEITDGAPGAPGSGAPGSGSGSGSSGAPGSGSAGAPGTLGSSAGSNDGSGAPGSGSGSGSPGAPGSGSSAGSPGAPGSGSGSSAGSPGAPGSLNGASASTVRAPASPTFAAGTPGAPGNSTGGRPVTVNGAAQTGISVFAVVAALAAAM